MNKSLVFRVIYLFGTVMAVVGTMMQFSRFGGFSPGAGFERFVDNVGSTLNESIPYFFLMIVLGMIGIFLDSKRKILYIFLSIGYLLTGLLSLVYLFYLFLFGLR